MIAGNAGILVARVIYAKPAEAKTFIIVDAAMNDLVRPTLYDAWHDIVPVAEPPQGARSPSSSMSWARCAKPATTWPGTAACRRSPRAISSPS